MVVVAIVASPEPVKIGTVTEEVNPTMTSFSKNVTTTREAVAVVVVVEVAAVAVVGDVPTVETGRSTGTSKAVKGKAANVVRSTATAEINLSTRISNDKVKHSGSTAIVPVVPVVQQITENGVRSTVTVERNRSTEISKVRRKGLEVKRVKETDNAEDPRINDRISAETREKENMVANASHLTNIKTMAEMKHGETSHVVRTNITTKSRSKIWRTCSQRNRKS